MAILDSVRKETSQIMKKMGLGSRNMMGTNFREYGAEMGIYDYEDYVRYARRIYQEAMKNPGGFTIIDLPKKQKAIDFQGKLRGVYDRHGEPVAFFKPDYHRFGFTNYREELLEFKASVLSAIS